MGPALLRLSSSSYCCLTVLLWYLFLSFSPRLLSRPKYDLSGRLVRQHGCVYPAVGELHLWLLYDVLLGDSLQRPWVPLQIYLFYVYYICILWLWRELSSLRKLLKWRLLGNIGLDLDNMGTHQPGIVLQNSSCIMGSKGSNFQSSLTHIRK